MSEGEHADDALRRDILLALLKGDGRMVEPRHLAALADEIAFEMNRVSYGEAAWDASGSDTFTTVSSVTDEHEVQALVRRSDSEPSWRWAVFIAPADDDGFDLDKATPVREGQERYRIEVLHAADHALDLEGRRLVEREEKRKPKAARE